MKRICRHCRQLLPVEVFSRGRVCDLCRAVSEAYRAAYLANWRKANGAQSSAAWRKRNPNYEKERYRRGKDGRGASEDTAQECAKD